MATNKTTPKKIDDYVGRFPKRAQELLKQMRRTIRRAVPRAEEVISYGIPSFKLGGNLVWFAGYKRHIGFYPGSAAIATFKKKLSAYKVAKGVGPVSVGQTAPPRVGEPDCEVSSETESEHDAALKAAAPQVSM